MRERSSFAWVASSQEEPRSDPPPPPSNPQSKIKQYNRKVRKRRCKGVRQHFRNISDGAYGNSGNRIKNNSPIKKTKNNYFCIIIFTLQTFREIQETTENPNSMRVEVEQYFMYHNILKRFMPIFMIYVFLNGLEFCGRFRIQRAGLILRPV